MGGVQEEVSQQSQGQPETQDEPNNDQSSDDDELPSHTYREHRFVFKDFEAVSYCELQDALVNRFTFASYSPLTPLDLCGSSDIALRKRDCPGHLLRLLGELFRVERYSAPMGGGDVLSDGHQLWQHRCFLQGVDSAALSPNTGQRTFGS